MPASIHSKVYKDLIERLIESRNSAGLTQQAVADRLDLPQSYVAKVEGFERRLDVIEYLEFANAIDLDPLPDLRTAWRAIKG